MPERENNYFTNDSTESRAQDLERIRIQSKFGFNQKTETFLDGLNLPQNMTIVDLGSGAGEALPILNKYANEIICVDRDEERLLKATDAIEAFNLGDRIKPLVSDVSKLDIPDSSVDMVYTRLFWQHFKKEQRFEGIKEAIRVLKPEGVLVAEDLVLFGPWILSPPLDAHQRLLSAFSKLYEKSGTEPNMGAVLPQLFNKFDLENVVANPYTIASFGDQNFGFRISHVKILETVREGITRSGIMSEADFDSDLEEFEKYIMNPEIFANSAMMVQVAGWKK